MTTIEFGEETRREHYLMDPDVAYVNHGSFGPCPRVVYEELRRLRFEQERNPDHWFRTLRYKYYVQSVRAAAQRLDCDFEQIALVDNATVGINALLKSTLPSFSSSAPARGRTVLCISLGYGAVLFTIEEAAKQRGWRVRQVNVKLPVRSKREFIRQFEDELRKCCVEDIRLAVIDHITSATAILLPIEELTQLFHSHKIPVVVDGAHGPGQVYPHLSLRKLTCDYYIGTFHKWMYAARGCSFLFVRNVTTANTLQPANTSWGYRPTALQLATMTPFHLQFINQGTRDESALLTLPRAIEFVDTQVGGFERLHQYNSTLSQQAKQVLEQRWGTQGKDLVPSDMHPAYLKMVRLPDLEGYEKTEADGLRLLIHLMEHYKLVSTILCVNNELYVRISTQIYNQINDYVQLANAIDHFRKIN